MSKKCSENSKMSSASDVTFMENACARIAEARGAVSQKERVWHVVHALRVSGNRAYEFLTGRALRVDGYEKDRAREVLSEIEAENERQKHADFAARLHSTLAHLRQTDPDFYRADIAALERALLRPGELDRAVGNGTD